MADRLVKLAPEAWPRLAGWLVPGQNCTPLGYSIVDRAFRDLGILEVPNGSNRGTRLDAWNRRAGTPLGSWWCAIWAGLVWADCGALVPENFSGTDYWLPFVKEGRERARPEPGDAVIYGLKKPGPVVPWGNAHHMGIIVRAPEPVNGQQFTLTIEGNRGFAGSTNNGVAVDIGPMLRTDILGYVTPHLASAPPPPF